MNTLDNIKKGKIVYGGMVRGRRNFLIVNLIVTAIYIWFLIASGPYIFGNLHGPYEFDSEKFLSLSKDIVIDSEIEMKKREDKTIPHYTLSDNSYLDGNKYRFNVKFDNFEPLEVKYTAQIETDIAGTKEEITMYSVCLGEINGRKIPVFYKGDKLPDSSKEIAGIFTKPAKVILSDISKLTSEDVQFEINEFMFDARGVEMNSEKNDTIFAFFGLLILLFLYIRLGLHYLYPMRHPTYKQLHKYGEISEIVNEIELQFEDENVYKEDKELISTDWIMTKELFKNKIVKNHRTSGRFS